MLAKTEEGIVDVPLSELTPENFIVPEGEEGYYHCLIEYRQWKEGVKISKPEFQTFEKRFFEGNGLHDIKGLGYTVTILHEAEDVMLLAKKKAAEQKQAIHHAAIEAAKKQLLNDSGFKAALMEQLKAELMASDELKDVEPTYGKADAEKPVKTKKTTK